MAKKMSYLLSVTVVTSFFVGSAFASEAPKMPDEKTTKYKRVATFKVSFSDYAKQEDLNKLTAIVEKVNESSAELDGEFKEASKKAENYMAWNTKKVSKLSKGVAALDVELKELTGDLAQTKKDLSESISRAAIKLDNLHQEVESLWQESTKDENRIGVLKESIKTLLKSYPSLKERIEALEKNNEENYHLTKDYVRFYTEVNRRLAALEKSQNT